MAESYACTYCKTKTSKGRFTRRKETTGNGWSQGFQLPVWACYTCVPLGQGRGEEGQVAKKAAPPVNGLSLKVSDAYVKEHDDVVAVLPTLQQAVSTLVITNEQDYLEADALLGRIDQRRKAWGGVWDRIQASTIKPLRSALDGLYELNRDIDQPLERLRDSVREAMRRYKVQELHRIEAAKREQEREAARLQMEAEEAARKAEAARTNALRARFEAQAEEKQERAMAVAAQAAPLPIVGASSTSRTAPKLQIKDLGMFLRHAADSPEMQAFITINVTGLNRQWKIDPDVELWPGVEKVDDVTIVGR
jgi:hypothetical protein